MFISRQSDDQRGFWSKYYMAGAIDDRHVETDGVPGINYVQEGEESFSELQVVL